MANFSINPHLQKEKKKKGTKKNYNNNLAHKELRLSGGRRRRLEDWQNFRQANNRTEDGWAALLTWAKLLITTNPLLAFACRLIEQRLGKEICAVRP